MYLDDVSTGWLQRRIRIVGRPAPKCSESWVILEEPGDPVNLHWMPKLRTHLPHYRPPRTCPHCEEGEEPVSAVYVGAEFRGEFGIMELNCSCYDSAAAASRRQSPTESSLADQMLTRAMLDLRRAMVSGADSTRLAQLRAELELRRREFDEEMRVRPGMLRSPCFRGLLCKISRGSGSASPRVLRCEQRLTGIPDWPYDTRRELARIWGIAVKPRIYREA